MSELPFAATTPVSVARVGLKARDAESLAAYYREVVGLQELSRADGAITLGAAERPLLVIEADAAAKPDDPRSAGLFHTAFLLPSRADLGRWINHATANKIRIEGASDHLVSEALYLTDPEGNGIEIYADRLPQELEVERRQDRHGDRAAEHPRRSSPTCRPATPAGRARRKTALSATSICASAGRKTPRPGGTRNSASTRWPNMAAQAVFLSSGGYHHHIGANSWHSAGAGRRDPSRSGLAWVEMRSDKATAETAREDPWGTVIRTVPGAAG